MKLPIQNIQSATERLRAYFGLRGAIPPELDTVVSPTALLQDLSSVQGRGSPAAAVSTSISVATPETQFHFLYNNPDRPTVPGSRDIWAERVIRRLQGTVSNGIINSISWGQGDPGAAGGTLSANGATRDLRFRNGLVAPPEPQFAGQLYVATTNLGLTPTVPIYFDPAPSTGQGWGGFPLIDLLIPPGWFVRFAIEITGIGSRLDLSWTWREFDRDSNPESP